MGNQSSDFTQDVRGSASVFHKYLACFIMLYMFMCGLYSTNTKIFESVGFILISHDLHSYFFYETSVKCPLFCHFINLSFGKFKGDK